MKRNNKRIYSWILFGILFSFSMICSAIMNITYFAYDAQYYWETARTVFQNGIHILGFPETFRGYFFPLIVYLFRYVFHGVWGWRILSNSMASFLFSFILPYIIRRKRIACFKDIVRGVIAYLLFFIMWGNYLQYPLSDLAASMFLTLGIVLLIWSEQRINNVNIIVSVVTGGCLYAAYNTRVVFGYGAILAILVFIIQCKKGRKILIYLFGMLVGGAIVALPQCMINHQYVGTYSPKVYTEQLYGYSHSLQASQIYVGITNPKYETYVGDLSLYPSNAVYFDDPIGNELIEREGLTIEQFRLTDVFKLFIKYPMDMLGIYIRHIITLLTPTYNQIYIMNMYNNKSILILSSIAMWILTGTSIILKIENREIINRNIWWILAIAFPGFLQLVGAVEMRFFLPIYIMDYYYIGAEVDYKNIWADIKKQKMRYFIVTAIIVVMWITNIGEILASNQEKVILINDAVEMYMLNSGR